MSYRKRPSIMQEQIQIRFQYDFVANISVGIWISYKIGKVEKDEALNYHWKQKKVTNKVV